MGNQAASTHFEGIFLTFFAQPPTKLNLKDVFLFGVEWSSEGLALLSATSWAPSFLLVEFLNVTWLRSWWPLIVIY